MARRKRRGVSKRAATKGKGKLKKGYRYVRGGRIVKARKKTRRRRRR